MLSRRQFVCGCAAFAAAAARFPRTGWCSAGGSLEERMERALTDATNYLAGGQATDGSWRSEIYGPFKDGPSLTSLIAATFAGQSNNSAGHVALAKAAQYFTDLVQQDGSIDAGPDGITYPVYVAAGAAITLTRLDNAKYSAARDAWIRYLRARQLTEELGWQSSDLSYGGWSYAPSPPTPVDGKPRSPLAVPNLSATVFALTALRTAGVPANDLAIEKARVFVERCQNWSEDPNARDAEFDDGGFFFIMEDPVRNKAGERGLDLHGRVRYASYGSTTADGFRALLACGQKATDSRVAAAGRWLASRFSAAEHPGQYAISREHLRPALFYYYSASVSEALCISAGGSDAVNWIEPLSTALLDRQRSDGSWVNAAVDVREDDPLVATPLAMRALHYCRQALGDSR